MNRLIHLVLFSSFYTLGFNQTTIDSLKKVIQNYALVTKPSFSQDTIAVNTYRELGNQYYKSSNDSCLLYYDAGLNLATSIKWKLGQAKTESAIGRYYRFLTNDFDNGMVHYQNAVQLYQEIYPDVDGGILAAEVLVVIGQMHNMIGLTNESIPYFEEALKIYSQANQKIGLIIVYNSLGQSHLRISQNAIALDYFEKGLALCEELNDPMRIAILQGNIGLTLSELGRYEEAEIILKTAFELDSIAGNKAGQIRHLDNLSSCYRHLGLFKQAILVAERGLALSKELGGIANIASSLRSVSIAYTIRGNYFESIELQKESLEYEKQLNNPYGMILCLTNMGINYMYLGNYPIALSCYQQAIDVRYEYNMDTTDISNELGNISLIYESLANYELALNYSFKALDIAKKNNDKIFESMAYGNIGTIYLKLGNKDKALEYYQMGIDHATEWNLKGTVAINLHCIGSIYYDNQEYDKALEFFTNALSIMHEMEYFSQFSAIYSNISLVKTEQGNFNEAIENGKNALKYALEFNQHADILNASRALYMASIRMNQKEMALQHISRIRKSTFVGLETSFFSLSENEREPYFESVENDLGAYHDFGLHYGNEFPKLLDTMFNIALSVKGLSLRSSTALRNIILNSEDSTLISDYDLFVDLKKQISDLNAKGKETHQLEEKARTLEKDIIKKSGAFRSFNQLRSIDWKMVQQSLKSTECAIEFISFKSEIDSENDVMYAALIVKPGNEHPIAVKLCKEKELHNILGVFQGNNLSFIEKVYGKKSEAKRELYEKIWQPLEPFLHDVKTVYYSPSGLLHKVSFGAICKEQDVYLSDIYNFRQMGSTGNLAFENNTELGELENFLLMGGVDYHNKKESESAKEVWNYLPGSLTETNSINTFLTKKKFGVNYFSGSGASEEVFKEKITSSSIVHIATHGFFFPDPEQVRAEMQSKSESENEELNFRGATNYANWSFVNNKNPLMRSGIVLANANDVWSRDPLADGEDGILTAQEVSNLDLRNAKLVVLSACETGLGDIKGSEGVFGLQRAFKMAGVKYLIMSLWQVPDKETSEFMILFYKNLIKLKDIPTAFQKTQKVMREKYDPYYWGAFVLIE